MSKSFVVTALRQGLTPDAFVREQHPICTDTVGSARYIISERLKKHGEFYIVHVEKEH